MPDSVRISSPLHPSWLAAQSMAESSNPGQPHLPPNLLMVGLLLVHEHRRAGLVCIRQDPVFIRSGVLGVFVPFDREIHEYAGVHLYGEQSVPNVEQVANTIQAISEVRNKDLLSTTVEFHSFDKDMVNASHLDLVRNLMLSNEPANSSE